MSKTGKIATHAITEQFIYATMPPHLKKTINQAHLENGTYDQLVQHLEMELELKGLETPDELQINTVSQQPTNTNADKHKPMCHHCKKRVQNGNQCHLLKRQKKHSEDTQNNHGNKNSGANNSIPNNNTNKNNNNYKNSGIAKQEPKSVYPPCETCGKTNSTKKCYHGTNATNRPPPRQRRPERLNQVQESANQNNSNETIQAATRSLN